MSCRRVDYHQSRYSVSFFFVEDKIKRTSGLFYVTIVTVASILPTIQSVVQPVRQQRPKPALWNLAEVLRDNGYETAGFIANFLMSSYYGFAQGFGRYVNMPYRSQAIRHLNHKPHTWSHCLTHRDKRKLNGSSERPITHNADRNKS